MSTKKTNILWSGRQYFSLENCMITEKADRSEILSTIVGCYEDRMYKVEYFIKVNQNWETQVIEINSHVNNSSQSIKLEKGQTEKWIRNKEIDEQFTGCRDVDIPLSPFTNSLPIRRLKLKEKESREISVIYCDILADKIEPVRQKYTCITASHFQYENVPNDFEATILVDGSGFVIDYPELFERKAIFIYE
jgi:uncharacterized protein